MDTRLNAVALTVVILLAGCRQPERGALAWRGAAAEAPDALAAAAMPDANATARRVWAGEDADFYLMSVSPDGRYVTKVDWSTNDLAVLDLRSGETHRVTEYRGEGWAEHGRFSRDGSRIAYVGGSGATARILIAHFDAEGAAPRMSSPRVIYDNPLQNPVPEDWSPDGRWVLARLYGEMDNINSIAVVSTAGEPARTLKTLDWRTPLRAAFSPDGRFVAYDLPSESDRRTRHIFVVSLDGTHERLVVGGVANNRLFGWAADGGILYVAQRGAAPALWRQPMTDGQPAGAPQLLREDVWRAEPIGLAGTSVHYGVTTESRALYVTDLDLERARPATPPRAIVDDLGGNATSMAWSPDGTHLAVIWNLPVQRGRRIAVHAADGTVVSELPLPLAPWLGRMQWAPDGRSVTMFARDERARAGYYRIDLETGARDVVLRIEPGATLGTHTHSRDGATLYFARFEERERGVLVARTLATGEERRIDTDGEIAWPGPFALSPDGTRFATLTRATEPNVHIVSVVPVDGGAHLELFRLRGRWRLGSMHWTRVGDHVLFVATRTEPPWEEELWLVPVNGGEARRLDGIAPDSRNAALHPNGRRLAYKTGQNRGEIWVLELGATAPTAALPAVR